VTYSKTVQYLYSLESFGIKLGLRNIRALLRCVGNPERSFPSIHIAGTNGKGSTASLIASIFQEAGYNVGLYTSPHLTEFTERIRINGKEIDRRDVIRHTENLRYKIDQLRATFFEATTAMAFLHFAAEKVDLAVVETGLGGRLDATNVLRPLLTVITSIGLEHTEYLGHTIGQIAREKAGIMKRGVPCLIGTLGDQAKKVMRTSARRIGSPLFEAPALASVQLKKETLDGIVIEVAGREVSYPRILVGLAGSFQAENARLAILASELVRRNAANKLTYTLKELAAGLKYVRRNTGLSGRLEVITRHPRIILDVAHNPDAVVSLVSAVRQLQVKRIHLVFGVMKDKDYKEMLQTLRALTEKVVLVRPNTPRAVSAGELSRTAQRIGFRASIGPSVANGLSRVRSVASGADTILVTGSHYVVGEALRYLKHRA
jgi:dihydrofolate synthase/folylpolyglutamate synthase